MVSPNFITPLLWALVACLAASAQQNHDSGVCIQCRLLYSHPVNIVRPDYPVLARQTKTQGRVSLKCVIGIDGSVEEIEVKKGHPLLIQASTDAVSKWKFKRPDLDGKPVKTVAIIDIYFQFAKEGTGQAQPSEPVKQPVLVFRARPTKHLFARGEDVVFVVSIRNESAGPVLVSRLGTDEFVDFSAHGPDGKEVPRRGGRRIDSKKYSRLDFAVIKNGEIVRARRIISLKNGQGFLLDKPGQYSMTAEYSMEPPEYFAPVAGDAKVPAGTFSSPKVSFCIERCGPDPEK